MQLVFCWRIQENIGILQYNFYWLHPFGAALQKNIKNNEINTEHTLFMDIHSDAFSGIVSIPCTTLLTD